MLTIPSNFPNVSRLWSLVMLVLVLSASPSIAMGSSFSTFENTRKFSGGTAQIQNSRTSFSRSVYRFTEFKFDDAFSKKDQKYSSLIHKIGIMNEDGDNRRILRGKERKSVAYVGAFFNKTIKERFTGNVTLDRDIITTAAHGLCQYGKCEENLDKIKFFFEGFKQDGTKFEQYDIASYEVGTKNPQSEPWNDWAVVKLSKKIRGRVKPLAVMADLDNVEGGSASIVAYQYDVADFKEPTRAVGKIYNVRELHKIRNKQLFENRDKIYATKIDTTGGASGAGLTIVVNEKTYLIAVHSNLVEIGEITKREYGPSSIYNRFNLASKITGNFKEAIIRAYNPALLQATK